MNRATVLRWSITLIGLAFAFSQIDFSTTFATITSANPFWLLLAFCLIILSLFIRAYRWHIIVHGMGGKTPFRRLATLYFVGNFFNAFLPSGFGGDVVRAVEATDELTPSTATATVLLDRMLGLMALFVITLIAMPFRPATFPTSLTAIISALALGGLVVGGVIIDGRIVPMLINLTSGFKPLAQLLTRLATPFDAIRNCSYEAVGRALGISLIFNLIMIGWWMAIGIALGYTVSYLYHLLVVPILSIAQLVPSIGGLGVRESLAPTLYQSAGLSFDQAVALALTEWIIMRLSSLLGAPIYLITSSEKGKM